MGNRFKLIETDNASEWYDLINGIGSHDIHYHPEYLSLIEDYLECKCFLFYFGNDKGSIFSPFFMKKIDHIPDISRKLGGSFQDLISPWYLTGPCLNGSIEREDIDEFWNYVEKYSNKHRVVSGFCKFNPHTEGIELIGDYQKSDSSLWLSLNENDEPVKKQINIDYIENIEDLEETEFILDNSKEFCNIRRFYDLYKRFHEEKAAIKHERIFPLNFVYRMINRFPENVHLIQVKKNERLAGAALFFQSGVVLHYYFGGLSDNSDERIISDIIINEAWKIATGSDLKIIDFGGELNGPGIFSGNTGLHLMRKNTYIYKKVYDRVKYKKICKLLNKSNIDFEKAEHFPEYRYWDPIP